MEEKTNAKKSYKQRMAQHKSLLMIGIIVFGLVFCSVLFDITYTLYQKGITVFEEKLKGRISWSDAHIGLTGVLELRNVYIYERTPDPIDTDSGIDVLVNEEAPPQKSPKELADELVDERADELADERANERVVLYGENVTLDMGIALMIKYFFLPLNKMSAYDRERLKVVFGKDRKTLSYIVLKSLQKIEVDTISANFIFPKDNHLFGLLEVALFSKKMLPYDGYLNLNHIYANITTPIINISTNDFDLDFNLSDSKGISAVYGGGVNVGKIQQEASLQIEGNFLTKDFFNNIDMSTTMNTASYNSIGITPIQLELSKSLNDMVFNVEWSDADINIIGTVKDDMLDVDIALSDAKISDMFIFDINEELKSLSEDMLSGTGRITGNLKEKNFVYELQIENTAESNNTIAVDISGNEDYINFSNLAVQLTDQYIIAKGGMSLLNFGLNGSVNFLLDKPLLKDKIRGDFYFTNTPFSSVGRSGVFYINDVRQDNIIIEYSKIERFFKVSTENIPHPIINISIDEYNTYDIRIQEFPMSIFASIYGVNKVAYLNNSYVNARINFQYQDAEMRDVTYNMEAFNTLYTEDTIRISGRYVERKVFIDESVFALNSLIKEQEKSREKSDGISGSFRGYFYTSFYDEEKNPVNIILTLEEQGVSTQYGITAKYVSQDVYRLSINKNLFVDITFENNSAVNYIDTISHIRLHANNFYVPLIHTNIDVDSSVVLNNTAILEAEIDISATKNVSDEDVFLLVLEASYKQGEGIINTLSLKNNQNIFEGIGDFSVSDTLINMNIIELPSLEDTQTKNIKGQSLRVNYGKRTKSINIETRNMRLGLFTDKINGVVNGDFLIDIDRESVLASVSESAIRLKSDKYTMSADFYLEGFSDELDMTVNNLRIVEQDNIIIFPEIKVRKGRSIDANFSIAKTNFFGDAEESYEGLVLINTEKPLIEIFDLSLDNPLERSGDFSGNILLTPTVFDDAELRERYSYNIGIKSNDGVTMIQDTRRNILIRLDNKESRIVGNIGGVQNRIFITLEGSYKPRDMKVSIDINHINMGLLNEEFFHNMDIIEIDNMLIRGNLGIQGDMFDPDVYGVIKVVTLDGFFPFFNKFVSFEHMNILISEKDISLVNAHFIMDKNILLMSMQGKLDGGALDYLNMNVSTKHDALFKANRFRISGVEITGNIEGDINVFVQDDIVDIKGSAIITNATVSNELFSARQRAAVKRGKTRKNTLAINAEITTQVNSGVVFAWPSKTFPVLKAGFSDNQKIVVGFEGELQEFSVHSNLFFDSGTIYYFDKPFDIERLEIRMDEFNTAIDPYIVSLESSSRTRYNDTNYTLELTALSTALSDMSVDISAVPYLSNNEIAAIFGQSIVPDTISHNTDASTSTGLVSSLIKISDPISNIGIFSRFENTLQRSLNLDYVSFRSKMVQNLLDYSLSSNQNAIGNVATSNSSFYNYNSNVFLPYLLDKSSFEVGKYIDIVYLNLGIELDTAQAIQTSSSTYNSESLFVPLKTSVNVEIPTPFVDFTWTGTVERNAYNRSNYIPMNFLTISWEKQF